MVERVGLGQVQDVERDLGRLVRLVDYLEVVPLRVALRVVVVLQPQVVLHVVHLRRLPQVPALHSTVKQKHVVQLRHLNAVLRGL